MAKLIDLRKKEEASPQINRGADDFEVVSWTGHLYYHEPDMRVVWIVLGIFIALAVAFQIFQKNIITTALMVSIGLMILFQAKRKHENVGEILLSPLGIKIGSVNHHYSDIKSFWVDYQPENGIAELSIQLRKLYMPYLRIPIEGKNPVRLRSFLIRYIPEERHEISLSEVVSRRLGL